jgi:2-phosphoglycerate kinase
VVERDWTLLLIGGGVGAGKSTLARRLAEHAGGSAIEADLFRLVLLSVVSKESEPDLHMFSEPDIWTRPVDELVERSLRSDHYLCRACESVIIRQVVRNEPAILEAVWLSPQFAAQDTFAGRTVIGEVRSLFLYEPEIDLLYDRFERRGSWWTQVPARERDARVAYFHAFGLEIKRQAEALGLPVLESRPFDTLLERALQALSSGSSGAPAAATKDNQVP